MSEPLYADGLISARGMALLAGVDEDTLRQVAAETGTSVATLPAPLVARMLANVDRIDPDRTLGIHAVIDHLAAADVTGR